MNARTAAYNSSLVSGHMDEYKAASYGPRRAVKNTKRRYRDRVELQMEQCDTTRLWQGLQTITDYQVRTPSTVSANASLVDDLNSFYARFEAHNNTTSWTLAEVSSIARDQHTLSVTKDDVRRALMRVNTRKATGSLSREGVRRRYSGENVLEVGRWSWGTHADGLMVEQGRGGATSSPRQTTYIHLTTNTSLQAVFKVILLTLDSFSVIDKLCRNSQIILIKTVGMCL